MNKQDNPFRATRIEYHILQSFPVTCLNRDDVGAPKSAIVGGVSRARISSQCWKRQVRLALHDFGVKLAIRTKKVDAYISKICTEKGASEIQSKECGEAIADFLTKDTLHFFTEIEAEAFADYAKEQDFDVKKLKDKDVFKLAKKVINPALDGIDIALFGRMVAKAAELNIEAAASFAHAISTHKVSNEIDFFTALDDLQDEPGSAHMGSLEFNSATYYRYISLDLGQLYQTLDGHSMSNAVESFTKALFVAVPSARQTTQSGASYWDFAKVLVRKGQRLQVCFDKPVRQKGEGFLKPSTEELIAILDNKEKMSGSLFGKIAEYTLGGPNDMDIDSLASALKKHTGANDD